MKKAKVISFILSMVGIMMISIALIVENQGSLTENKDIEFKEINLSNVAASTNMLIKNSNESEETTSLPLEEINMEVVPASVYVPPRVEVYAGLTIEELSAKLDRSLGGILAGHGNTIAQHSLDLGVDPYVAAAIMIHETGNGTSRIANNCYNFGGQKGYGCGAYKKYDTVDEGLIGIIDNLYKNYYAYGLNTIESIGSKYAESTEWPTKIHWYVDKISNS
mgnify:CR=1 FL=1